MILRIYVSTSSDTASLINKWLYVDSQLHEDRRPVGLRPYLGWLFVDLYAIVDVFDSFGPDYLPMMLVAIFWRIWVGVEWPWFYLLWLIDKDCSISHTRNRTLTIH